MFQGASVAFAVDAENASLLLLEQLQWSKQWTGEPGTAPGAENFSAPTRGVRRRAESRGDARARSSLGNFDIAELRGPHAGAQRELVV